MARIKNWTKKSAEELWQQWRCNFESDDEAVATAIWIANRLVKDKAKSTKRKFYSIKDEFIRRHQENAVGRKVRDEHQYCYSCGGHGYGELGSCRRCRGTGIYRERWLYVHQFEVAGQQYSFHSYQKPLNELDEPGEDKEEYGGSFSEEELAEMALPMTGFLRLLSYVAAAMWNMMIVDGRYQ